MSRTNPYDPWSDADRQRIAGMVAEGWSYSKIAFTLGISRSAVAGVLYRLRQRERDMVRAP